MNHNKQLITKIVEDIRYFQKENNIKQQCITNTQYLYDCLTHSNIKFKIEVIPVFVVSRKDKEELRIFNGHLVVKLEDEILEASNDIYTLKNKEYILTIKDYINFSKYNKSEKYISGDNMKDEYNENECIKKSITTFLEFVKYADKINNGGLLYCDKEYYNNLADYIETQEY